MIFFAAAAANQQDLIKDELAAVGIEQVRAGQAGVEFVADFESACRFTMTTRIASRVLEALYFDEDVESADELYQSSLQIPWEEYLTPESTFLISETVKNCPWLNNSHFAALKVKDAIVDRIKEHNDGARPNVEAENPDITFHIHIKGGTVIWYIDFSGPSLAKRGYRGEATDAVLKENLAAAILYRSEWYKSFRDGKLLPLLDPFCGSGTLAVEAALIASDTAPGLLRKEPYAFEKIPGYDAEIHKKVIAELEEKREKAEEREILVFASDISRTAVEISKAAALKAGVYDIIRFDVRDFLSFTADDVPAANGVIVTDPPYGVRLKEKNITALYAKTGRIISDLFKGWSVSILAGEQELLSYIDMKPERTNTIYNGGILCQIAHYRVYTDEEREALKERAMARRAERLSQPLTPGAEMAYNRLVKNLEAIKPQMEAEGVTCYRIYDADMPEYSAAIDLYEGKWINLQEYAPPATIDPEAAERRLNELILATERATGIDLENIYVKQRKEQKGKDQYKKLASSNKFFIVRENGLKYLVNFTDYLDTGVFLDHRPVRKLISTMSGNKRFLNLFCYTSTATLNALKGGALSTVSVDASATYLDWSMENLKINKYDTNMGNFFYRSDVLDYLYDTWDKFDLIFCDPPTFSNSKSRNSFDVQLDHVRLINAAMMHLEKDGVLIFSNNYRKFKMDESVLSKFNVVEITKDTIGADFARDEKIHHCYLIRHKVKIEKKEKISVKVKQPKED
jgi:Predicted N6-adenine-specific DNA methylase